VALYCPSVTLNSDMSVCGMADRHHRTVHLLEDHDNSVMVSTESPAVARRRLRLALRKVREAKGVTQGQVAEALEWSLSKVNRIESGDVTISNTDLRALLSFLGVTENNLIERLTDDARASRRRGWWDEPRYREHLNPATLQFLQFESEATAIRCFQPIHIPGLLQTPAYAESIFNFWRDTLTEADRTARLAVRMRRRSQILDRPDPPQYFVIVDESVVLRAYGGPQAMAEQLEHVRSTGDMPHVIIRVLPLARSAMSMLGAFTILDLGDEENAVLYRESALGDEIVHASDHIGRHRRIFEQMWEESLSAEASGHLIAARAAEALVSHDRGRTSF
jgi:transcriptional regulator with XRE-family HTH domain